MENKLPVRGYSQIWFLGKSFSQFKFVYLIFFFQFFFICAFGQVTITGNVKDSKGEMLQGVTVILKGSHIGNGTNDKGQYSINLPNENGTLIFSHIGYISQEVAVSSREIAVSGKRIINVILEETATSLQSVVVIGFGTQSSTTLTTAISKLDTKVLQNVPLGNAESALQGTIPGVIVQTASGQPGSAPSVIIRGGTSINNPGGATPLYIVDGVIRQNIDDLNSSDIESMQVLKDAASTAIYGARASNGVVIITTKSGKKGKTSISYKYTIGFSRLAKKYNVLSARDYIYYSRLGVAATGEKHPERLVNLTAASGFGTGNDLTNNTAFSTQYLNDANRIKLSQGWQSMPDPLNPSETIIFENNDWQDILFRTGITNDHYLNFSGGTDKSSFDLSLGLTDVNGIAINTDYKRYTVNFNNKLQVKKNISVFDDLDFSRSSNNAVFSENSIFGRSIESPPTQKLYFEDGTLAPGLEQSLGNPLYYLGRTNNNTSTNTITLSGGLKWNLLPGLSFEPTASLLYIVNDLNDFQKSYFNGPVQFVNSRTATGSYTKWDQQQVDAVLHYDRVFGGFHHFQGVIGASYFNRVYNTLSATGSGAATDLIPTLNASALPVSVSSSSTQQVIDGYFGRIIYDYKQKYLFSASARYDGASNLGDKNKWGIFPGVSAGWNVHKEDFWNDPAKINRLKLRASYGVTGNLGDISDYQAQGQYSVGQIYQGAAAVEYTTLANEALRWEQSKTFDIGLDAGALQDRIRLTFDYYNRITDNLLTSLPLPYSTGFSSIITNYGSLGNKGIELELGSTIVKSKNVTWDLSFNFSNTNSKILKLPNNGNANNRVGGYYVYDPKIKNYTYLGGLQEGGRVGDMYGYKFLGVYATDAEAEQGPYDKLVVGSNKTKSGGDVNWLDVDGNDTIDTRDMVYMGNPYPKWSGGFSSTVSYKGLSLYIRCDFETGYTIYNYLRASLDGQFIGATNSTTDLLKSWLKQGDITNVPRYYWADQVAEANYWRGDPRSGSQGSSQNFEKGDYLAIREITLSYNAPESWYKPLGLDVLRVFVTASNLKYFTKYTGFSPEVGGLDTGRYPVPQSFMFGANISF
ncbi:MAG TPA: TonB-dependent receptor [Hanamia sp.]|nr:TonB-dependent receptor [Hanamia sp.]